MGTLPIIHLKKFRLVGPSTRLPVPVYLVLITVIGIHLSEISCSGNVDLGRPYLFRDFGMPAAHAPPLSAHAQIANLYHSHRLSQISKAHHNQPSSHSTESSFEYNDEAIGSSEEDPGFQYTAPLILDIDDPEEKARWMGFNTFQDQSNEDVDDVDEEEEGSISSTEFQSRSGVMSSSAKEQSSEQEKTKDAISSRSRTGDKNDGSKRGIMDYIPMMNFWGGDEAQAQQHSDFPQSDEMDVPFYDYQQYLYQPYGTHNFQDYEQYFQESLASELQASQKPTMMMKPKEKSKPKPLKKQKSKPKVKKPKRKLRPQRVPMPMKHREPHHPPHRHPQKDKPGKLSMMKEHLSRLNPFRSWQKDKKPSGKPPRRRPPMMMKGKRPKPMEQHPQSEEGNPEFVMILGEPSAFGDMPDMQRDSQEETEDAEETANDDAEDEDEDEDEENDEENEEDNEEDDLDEMYEEYGNQASPTVVHSEDEVEGTLSDDETIRVEDDEQSPYEDSSSYGLSGERESPTGATRPDKKAKKDTKEKSINIVKSIGFRRRKRRPHKRVPARRPPHWKEYRPAPLVPELEGLSDALLKVVKNVGFLPEYGKEEKYGGHHKIKGKYTKTRPITLHHGLLTEVVRRR